MDKIYIIGDSYSYGFLKHFKYIKSEYIKVKPFYGAQLLIDYECKLNEGYYTNIDIKKQITDYMVNTINPYNPDIIQI